MTRCSISIASPAWDDAPLWSVLAQQADKLVSGPQAWLVIGDTALPKKGTILVGVLPQGCGQLGKKANCQSPASLTLAQGEVPVPIGLRLFLPEKWTNDSVRCAQAGVPEAAMALRSKGEIAINELDQLRAADVRFGTVLADAGYDASAASARAWTLETCDGQWVSRATRRSTGLPYSWWRHRTGGRKPVPDEEPAEAEKVLAELAWRRMAWRQGTKGALAARFAVAHVRVGDGAV